MQSWCVGWWDGVSGSQLEANGDQSLTHNHSGWPGTFRALADRCSEVCGNREARQMKGETSARYTYVVLECPCAPFSALLPPPAPVPSIPPFASV